jgi:hypothetical protein
MMTSPLSTRIFRGHRSKKPAVELCPYLAIKEIEADLNRVAGFGHVGSLRIPNRLDVSVNVFQVLRRVSLFVTSRCHVTHRNTRRTIDLVRFKNQGGDTSYQFICPGSSDDNGGGEICGRILDTLYLVERLGEEYFACTRCHNMTYWSTQRGNYHQPRAKRARGKSQENPPVPLIECFWIPAAPAPSNRVPVHA